MTEVAGEQDAELSETEEDLCTTGLEREKKISDELESIIDGPLIGILPYLQKHFPFDIHKPEYLKAMQDR